MRSEALLALIALAGAPQTGVVSAPPAAGDIELMVLREVNGNTAKPGDPVRLQVNRAVTVGGRTVPAGTPAWGEVTDARSSRVAMTRGTLSVRLVRMVIDGSDVALSGDILAKGHGGKSDDVVKMMFAPWYAVFSPGNAGKLKAGEIVYGTLPADAHASASTATP